MSIISAFLAMEHISVRPVWGISDLNSQNSQQKSENFGNMKAVKRLVFYSWGHQKKRF
jgi:hypothetical protein